MLCGGHVNRAHTKQLKEMVNVKAFLAGFKSRYRRRFLSGEASLSRVRLPECWIPAASTHKLFLCVASRRKLC